jgi:hypothetical protein
MTLRWSSVSGSEIRHYATISTVVLSRISCAPSPSAVGCGRPRRRRLRKTRRQRRRPQQQQPQTHWTVRMAASNWMFRKSDEFEKQFRPRPSLPASAYISPRPVPRAPSVFTSSIRSVFGPQRKNKGPAVVGFGTPASASALSLRSGDLSDSSPITSTYSHPYSSHDAPPIVPSRDTMDEEAECPVCLEPLSFSFRLPGEKPHIVPECGHALHEVPCFRS